ncbi:FecR domain-containing protein [Pontimicrobium sp. SW4]|uniref:FecR domain-containing protein n=1 Tax=Pontimicrobium sp. SW4 TaxID=3153519 RepID=A0AAU7BU53_9FLAO
MEQYQIKESDIWAYISGNADITTVNNVEKWIKSSKYDEQLFNKIVAIYESTEAKTSQVDIDVAKQRFFTTISNEEKNTFSWKSIFKYAAVIALIITTATFTYQSFSNNDLVNIQTAYSEHKQIDLPDGSVVWLNSSSEISYNEKSPRTIKLIGEAFFEVAKNKDYPFTVETLDNVIVKALGTSFNVNAYQSNSYTETTLFTGKVEVSAENYFDKKIILLPNDQVKIMKENGDISNSKTDNLKTTLAWKNGQIEFNNKPFVDIASDLSNQYNIQLRFENDDIALSKFTGSFKNSTPIREILDILKISKEFEYKLNQETNEWIIK